jgi:hypothetical protein
MQNPALPTKDQDSGFDLSHIGSSLGKALGYVGGGLTGYKAMQAIRPKPSELDAAKALMAKLFHNSSVRTRLRNNLRNIAGGALGAGSEPDVFQNINNGLKAFNTPGVRSPMLKLLTAMSAPVAGLVGGTYIGGKVGDDMDTVFNSQEKQASEQDKPDSGVLQRILSGRFAGEALGGTAGAFAGDRYSDKVRRALLKKFPGIPALAASSSALSPIFGMIAGMEVGGRAGNKAQEYFKGDKKSAYDDRLRMWTFVKVAQQLEPEDPKADEEKFHKRRQLMARLIPALLGGAAGGVLGAGSADVSNSSADRLRLLRESGVVGKMLTSGMELPERQNVLLRGLAGAGIGAGLGYGGGALLNKLRDYTGTTPLMFGQPRHTKMAGHLPPPPHDPHKRQRQGEALGKLTGGAAGGLAGLGLANEILPDPTEWGLSQAKLGALYNYYLAAKTHPPYPGMTHGTFHSPSIRDKAYSLLDAELNSGALKSQLKLLGGLAAIPAGMYLGSKLGVGVGGLGGAGMDTLRTER